MSPNLYDEENIDIEAIMIQGDILEEEAEQYGEERELEFDEIKEVKIKANLTPKFLKAQLNRAEYIRNNICLMYDDTYYEGKVIHHIKGNFYIFAMSFPEKKMLKVDITKAQIVEESLD